MLYIFKIIALFLVFIICTILGMYEAKKYDNRVEALKQIKNALEVLKSKIEFTYAPIKDNFIEISKIVYKNEKNIFQDCIENMKDYEISEAWNIAVDNDSSLIKEDKSTIKMFGKLLGKTDKSGQINEINLTSKLLDSLIDKAEQEKNKNYKLFRTLGSTIGIGLCIILI